MLIISDQIRKFLSLSAGFIVQKFSSSKKDINRDTYVGLSFRILSPSPITERLGKPSILDKDFRVFEAYDDKQKVQPKSGDLHRNSEQVEKGDFASTIKACDSEC